jgi:hypothetical protein
MPADEHPRDGSTEDGVRFLGATLGCLEACGVEWKIGLLELGNAI